MKRALETFYALLDVFEHGHALFSAKPPSHPWVQHTAFDCCRHALALDALIDAMTPKRLKKLPPRMILMIGLNQLLHSDRPAHAVINECVQLTQKKSSAHKGMVNAILRRFTRETKKLQDVYDKQPTHPLWLEAAIKAAWPDSAEHILHANDQHPPMICRVNLQKHTRKAYLAILTKQDINASTHPETDAHIILKTPMPVAELPGFEQGHVSVQDGYAGLAVQWLDPQPGEHILDACAAPGGKSAHLLEACPDIHLTACDADAKRLASVEDNLKRLGLSATLRVEDASSEASDSYDRILIDAPCSGTGVIRRHPDIKHLRRESDIAQNAALQKAILDNSWKRLKPGGTLVYATCSILPDENQKVSTYFSGQHLDAEFQGDQQYFPSERGDGFYYAKWVKQSL